MVGERENIYTNTQLNPIGSQEDKWFSATLNTPGFVIKTHKSKNAGSKRYKKYKNKVVQTNSKQ